MTTQKTPQHSSIAALAAGVLAQDPGPKVLPREIQVRAEHFARPRTRPLNAIHGRHAAAAGAHVMVRGVDLQKHPSPSIGRARNSAVVVDPGHQQGARDCLRIGTSTVRRPETKLPRRFSATAKISWRVPRRPSRAFKIGWHCHPSLHSRDAAETKPTFGVRVACCLRRRRLAKRSGMPNSTVAERPADNMGRPFWPLCFSNLALRFAPYHVLSISVALP